MKKMRKLIPAFAMLLVSAIMMSTASFAWFTMNEEVTVTGMQVQAIATGSLVISTDPLTYESTGFDVDFSDEAVKELTPIHLTTKDVAVEDENGPVLDENQEPVTEEKAAWMQPVNTAAVHPLLGTPDYQGLTEVSPAGRYVEEIVYIGTAGENAISGNLEVSLQAIVSAAGTATKAYAVAVYVLGTASDKDAYAQMESAFAADTALLYSDIVYVDTADTRNEATIALGDVVIPSIVGIGEETNPDGRTGLMIGLRVFVDGNLPSVGTDTKKINVGYAYTDQSDATYDANNTYYTRELVPVTSAELSAAPNGQIPLGWYVKETDEETQEVTYTEATGAIDADVVAAGNYYRYNYKIADLTLLPAEDENGDVAVPEGWFTRAAAQTQRDYNYNYVNSGAVPSSGSTLAIKFSADVD